MSSPLRKTILTSLTLLLLLATTGWLQSAAAQEIVVEQQGAEKSYWARWTMEMDFANDQVNARWTVFLGETDAQGEMFITNQQSESIACDIIGKVTIAGEEATFDGTGHLTCLIPSFYEAVKALAGGNMPFPDTIFSPTICKCQNPLPWIAADLTLATPDGLLAPLVYQVDQAMEFAILKEGDLATSHLLLNQGAPVSETLQWPINLDRGNQLWSGSGVPNFLLMADSSWAYSLSEKFYDIANQLSLADYFHWADTAPQGVVFSNTASFSMTNEQTIFLVGFNGQDHFTGKIKRLAWDPPCGPQDGK